MITYDSYKAIADLDLDQIKFKLMHATAGEGWSEAKAEAIDIEYRRFLYLHLRYPDDQHSPSEDVDMFWHYHILDTKKYAADCDTAFGYFLHHYPYLGLLDSSNAEAAERAAALTRQHYESTFGQSPVHSAASGGRQADQGTGKQVKAARCSTWCGVFRLVQSPHSGRIESGYVAPAPKPREAAHAREMMTAA